MSHMKLDNPFLIRGYAGPEYFCDRIAETRQVLIFTCHTREAEYFAKDRRVTRLTLK